MTPGKLYKINHETLWYIGLPPYFVDYRTKTKTLKQNSIVFLLVEEYPFRIDSKQFYMVNVLDNTGQILSCGSRLKGSFINPWEEI